LGCIINNFSVIQTPSALSLEIGDCPEINEPIKRDLMRISTIAEEKIAIEKVIDFRTKKNSLVASFKKQRVTRVSPKTKGAKRCVNVIAAKQNDARSNFFGIGISMYE
jgi:hypothetical protein